MRTHVSRKRRAVRCPTPRPLRRRAPRRRHACVRLRTMVRTHDNIRTMAQELEVSDDDQRRAAERLTTLYALITATDRRDDLFVAVNSATDQTEALNRIMTIFDFDEPRAQAALDLQVRRFTRESRQRID